MWEEPLIIPTYEVGIPDPNPRFYAGRAYQGLAFQKSGQKDKANRMFDGLIEFGNNKLETLKKEGATMQFFAKFRKKRSKNE